MDQKDLSLFKRLLHQARPYWTLILGIFLVDIFGNETLLHTEKPGCYDPMPLAPRRRPPVIPSDGHLAAGKGYFYLYDVYQGSGMDRVPRSRGFARRWCSGLVVTHRARAGSRPG